VSKDGTPEPKEHRGSISLGAWIVEQRQVAQAAAAISRGDNDVFAPSAADTAELATWKAIGRAIAAQTVAQSSANLLIAALTTVLVVVTGVLVVVTCIQLSTGVNPWLGLLAGAVVDVVTVLLGWGYLRGWYRRTRK
jgi:hypothetical protein